MVGCVYVCDFTFKCSVLIFIAISLSFALVHPGSNGLKWRRGSKRECPKVIREALREDKMC